MNFVNFVFAKQFSLIIRNSRSSFIVNINLQIIIVKKFLQLSLNRCFIIQLRVKLMRVNISSSYLPEEQPPSIQFPEIYSANVKRNAKKQAQNHYSNSKYSYSRSKGVGHSKSPSKPSLTISANIADTRYQIIERVMMQFGWKLQYSESSRWDLKWIDTAVTVDFLSKMTQYQKINHFPGMSTLSRKNTLAKNLKRMQQLHPHQYNFFPRTFLLPQDGLKLRNYATQARKRGILKTYIVKPQAGCQGRGIFLTQSINEIQLYENCVVQKYIPNPLLYKGLKFDLRVYCLLAGCDPMRIYIYNEGLVRLATERYAFPSEDNMDDLCMHLTNYAINKQSPKYVYNDSIDNLSFGHKKSMAQFFQTLKSHGLKAHNYWSDIKDIIIKTIACGQPHLQHQYRIAQPNNLANNMCFQILGFDFMIDDSNKSFLLQINHTPSFVADTPLDQLIKSNLIRDTLILMNISQEQKANALQQIKSIQQRRVYTGKTIKLTVQQRAQKVRELQEKREMYEGKNLGSYQRIFPSRNKQKQRKYQILLQTASQLYKQGSGTLSQQTASYSGSTNQQLRIINSSKGSPYKFRVKKLVTSHNEDEAAHEQKYNKVIQPRQKIQRQKSKSKIQNQVDDNSHSGKRLSFKVQTTDRQSKEYEPSSQKSLITKQQQMTMFSRNLKDYKERISAKIAMEHGHQ